MLPVLLGLTQMVLTASVFTTLALAVERFISVKRFETTYFSNTNLGKGSKKRKVGIFPLGFRPPPLPKMGKIFCFLIYGV